MAVSFGRGNFPGIESDALNQLEDRYAARIEEGMQDKLLEAMDAKTQAGREHREYRLRQYMAGLRAQLAALRGEPATFPSQPTPQEERLVEKWRRTRQFAVFLVETESGAQARTGVEPGQAEAASTSSGGGRAAVACAALSMLQVEALLPPPFPSNKPFRLYVSNMAVVPDFRRRGLARQLLRACERQARLWGHSSLWLHVNKTNLAAIALYSSMGFRPVEEGGLRLLPGPLGQLLMAKDLPPLAHGCPVVLRRGAAAAGSTSGAVAGAGAAPGEVGVTGVAGSKRGGDGVFVWNAVVGKGGQGGEGSEQS